MATEAEIPESVISGTKSEREIVYSVSGQFESTVDDTSLGELKKFQGALTVPSETVEYSSETKNSQATDDVGAEAMNTVIKVNVESPEGEHFLGSPSAVPVSTEDTCRISKNTEGNEILESDKQVEATGDTETEENKATEESDEKPEKSNMSHDIGNLTGTSLLITKTEESNLMIKEESLKEESIIENKEAEKAINLMEEVPESAKPSERVADEDEKEKSMHGGDEETFPSTTDIKSDEEATLEVREEAGYEADEKFQEASGISYDEKSQDKIEPSKKVECRTPVEDEMNHKNGMDTESLKVVPKIWSDGIIKESPDEFEEQIEMSERIEESESTSNEPGKENESPEQKGDDSFMKHMGTLSANELPPAKEASSGENKYEEESSVTATKDNIAETEIIVAFEHKQSGKSNSEERPENLQQNEPGKEKLEGSFNVVAEDFKVAAETIKSAKAETPIKIQEKIFEEETKKDLPKHAEANEPLIELNEKTECGEIEVPNKNVNDLHVTHALVEEAGQNEGKNLDEVFTYEPEGKIQEAYEACTEVEKQTQDAPEAWPSANSTILEQTSIEGAETAELIPKARETDKGKLQEASGPDFEEKSVMVDDGENTDQEMQKNIEACDTVKEEILANSTDAGKCVIDAEASDEVNNAVTREEKFERSIQVESPPEAAPELTGQDKRCIAEDNNNRNNITNEEERDGTKVAATVVAVNEQVIEDNDTQISPESIDKQNVESCESNKNVAENSEGENNREKVTEDNNIRCLLPESVDQDPINDLKQEKKEAELSTEEILENSDRAEAAESSTEETIKATESPKDILDGSTVQQEESLQSEERNITRIETSPDEKRNEGTSRAIVIEENGGDSEPADAEDNMETKIAESEEYLKHISQRNESGEELPSSLSMPSDKEEVFNSDADKTPGDVEEEPIQNLEEAPQKGETEVKTDAYCKTSMEENSLAQLYQDSNDGGKDEETEKHNINEECSITNILLESIGEESLQSSKEEKVDQSIELEEEKIKQSCQGDESKQGNDTYISHVLTEQETLENSEGNKNKAANTKGEHEGEQMVEETNRGLVPESVEQSPVKNLDDDDKMKEDEFIGEITENSKTSEVAESATHETSTTIRSTTEIVDTSLVKQRESLENEEKNQIATEFLAERTNKDGYLVILAKENSNDSELFGAKDNTEKEPSIGEEDLQHTPLEKEPEEKHERSIFAMSNENEAFSSNADKTPCLTEEGPSQDFDEALQKEDDDKGAEAKNDTKDSNIATEENIEIVDESSDETKITDEGMVLELKLEEDRMLAQDELKKEESEEVYEDSKNADESESEKLKTLEECSATNILSEPTEKKTQQSFEEGKEEETPKTEVCLELETTSVREDAAERQNEDGTSQDLDEAPQQENDQETEEKNDTQDNNIAAQDSIDKVAESSDASKGTQIAVLEPKSENDKVLVQDEIKNEESTELYGDSRNADKSKSEKHNKLEECGTTNILLEPTEDKTHQNCEEGIEEETLKTEACLELETTIVGDAAEKQISEGENRLEQSRELEVEKVEKSSKENDAAAKTYKEEECEITQIASSDDKGRQKIEKGGAEEDKVELLARGTDNGDSLYKKNEEKEHDKQVDDANSFTEEAEATVPEIFKNRAESNVNSYPLNVMKESDAETPTIENSGGLIEESALASHMSNKKTEKETEEREETAINDSDSASIALVTEGKGLPEAEPEDKKQIARICPAFEEEGIAEIETEETNLESLDVSVKPEDTSDSGEKRDNEIPTLADRDGETNEGLIQKSAMVSHTPNKEIEEEITEKGEVTIEDSDSAPITVVTEAKGLKVAQTEAKGLKEAQQEDKEQVESVGPAFEEKSIADIETKVTTLESVDNNVESEVTPDLVEKRDNEIPTVADAATETNEGLIEESVMVSHASHEETEEEITEKKEICIEDSDSASTTVVTETKGQQQVEPEDKKQVESVGPAFEEKGVTKIEIIETTLENVDISVSPVDTTDLSEKRDDENPTLADMGSETTGGPTAEYATVSHTANKGTEEEIEQSEEIIIDDSDSSSIIVVTEKKGLQEAEPEDKKQVENVVPASQEEGIAESETKERTLENVDINVKPEDTTYMDKRYNENSTVADNEISTVKDKVGETNEGLTEESAIVSHMQDKETEEEIKVKEETTIDDSDSASIAAVTEAKGWQAGEPEDKKLIESVCPAFEEKDVAEIETKETTLESVDVSVKPEDSSDLGKKGDNDISTISDKAGEKNEGLVEESAMVSHTPNMETEEEITEKGEDLDSVSLTVVSEAKGLQEAEPEDKEQRESVGPAFEEKGLAEIETKVTTMESVDSNVESEVTSNLVKKRDNEIPTLSDTARETNEGLIEESAVVSHASNKETEEEIKEKEETSIEDSDSESITPVTEAKGQQQAEPEDKKQVDIVGPAFEEKGMTEIETKKTTVESVDINVSPVVATDLSKKRGDENPTVGDKDNETNRGLTAEYATVSHASNEETREEIEQKGEISIEDSDSASITVVTEAKGLQEAEPENKKQVQNVVPASQEKSTAEIETKETTLESVGIGVKPEDTTDLDKKDNENSTVADNEIPTVTDTVGETNEGLIEYSATVSQMQGKETEEEIKEKEETTIDDSDSSSNTAVTEAKGPQETEPEDKKQVESVDPAFEEKGIAETETKERTLESVDISVKAEDTSDLGEKGEKEIPNVADEPGETMDCVIKNYVPDAGSEDQTKVTTTDKSLEEISKDAKLTTTEMSERIDETPAQDLAAFENAESTCVAEVMDEMSMNKQATTTNPVNISELKSIDAGKENANEVQKQKVPENAKNFSESEDMEISKGEETRKLVDQGNVYQSTTLKDVESLNLRLQMEKTEDGKLLDATLKTFETSGEHTESEKAILEEEISAGNLEEVEVEPEGEAHFQRHEDVNNTDDGTATEEKLECTSEAVTENQTNEMLPESDKSQMEENSCENQNQEHDKEIKEKEESQLEAEAREELNANETTKAVILTQKEREGVEQSDDSEEIKELVVEEERGINELHASSTLYKTSDEIESSAPESNEYDKAVDLKEQMEVGNSEIEEDSTRETEISLTRESEEEKSQDINIGPDLKESQEKIGDTVEESPDGYNKVDNAILTARTDTSSGEAELGDKLEKDFHVEAAEAENSQHVKEVDSVKLEETFELVAELALNDNGHAERESIIVENIDASEPEEIKIASETVSESKDLVTEEAISGKRTVEKTDQIPTNNDDNAERENAAMENSDADEAEETKSISNPVDVRKDLGAEETAEAVKGPTAENIDRIPTSDYEHTQSLVEIEIVADEIKIVSDTIYESKGRAEEEAEVGECQIAEKTDQVPTDGDDDLVERKNEAIENSGADKVEQIKTVSDAVDEAKDQGNGETAETGKSPAVEKRDREPTSNCEHAQKESVAMENPKADGVNEINIVPDATCESKNQVTEENAEEIPTVQKLDQTPAANSEQVEEDRVITQYLDVEEVKDQINEDIDEAGKNSTEYNPDANKIEEASKAASGMEPVTEYQVIFYQTPSEEKLNVQLPTPTSTLPFKAETISTIEKIEEEKPEVEKLEDEVLKDSSAANQTQETCLQTGYREFEVSTRGFNTHKAIQDSSTEVYVEEVRNPDEIISTVEKIEEEKPQVEKLKDEALDDSSAAKPTEETRLQTGSRELEVSTQGFNIDKDVQDSSTEVYEEEDQNTDEALKLEPQQNENKIKCADSSSETGQSQANTDLTGPTEKVFILESETETCDKALHSEAIIPSHENPSESEDTEIKYKHLEVISDVSTEEVQFKKTSESIEITENEVSKEEIIEEKEVAETCQPISLREETLNKSLQGDDGLQEECRGDDTNDPFKTTVVGIQYEEPSVETEESPASTNIREQVAAEDTYIDDSDRGSVENKTIKESFPRESEGNNVDDSAIKFGTENLDEESNVGSGKTEATAPRDEEPNMEISKKESIQQFGKDGELNQETQESKESSGVITKMQIPTQAELIEGPDTIVQTDNEYDPPVCLEGITESLQKGEAGDLKPGNAIGVHSEAEVKHEGEQRSDCSVEETNEGTLMVDSNKASLSDLFQRSRKEPTQVAKHANKETESTAITDDNQTVKPETIQVKEAKVDKEKEEEDGDEHNRTDSSASHAAVMVEGSKDIDVKAAHKKSRNILSGVGSKVKHSISKVKKVITGKSSHSK